MHFGAGPLANHQRHDTDDECEGCHDNRAESEFASVQGGLSAGETAIVAGSGKLNNQNRIFAGQTDQHNKTDLRENRDVESGRQHSGDRAQKAHRNDQNHS